MDVTCTSCGAKLKIPDSKLPPPQVRMVSITCPKCKSKLKIDRTKPDAGLAPKKKPEIKPEKDLALKRRRRARRVARTWSRKRKPRVPLSLTMNMTKILVHWNSTRKEPNWLSFWMEMPNM